MAPLAYLAPPISGAVAFLFAVDPRVRFHGLQSVAIGASWPVILYVASIVSSIATQLVFAIGLLVWIGSFIVAAVGRDVRLPVIGPALARAAGLSDG